MKRIRCWVKYSTCLELPTNPPGVGGTDRDGAGRVELLPADLLVGGGPARQDTGNVPVTRPSGNFLARTFKPVKSEP